MMEKIRGLSLFSNVGVAEAYFEDIGVAIKVANEIDEKRAKFYEHLYPKTKMICGDITDDNIRDEIVNQSIENKVNFIIATPPCQGMSEAGLRKEFDERNQLIFYAIDVIKRIKPEFILLENVPKQLTTKIVHNDEIMLIPEYIKMELGMDYKFNDDTLIKARYQGVPQLRERNIYILVRNDIDIKWEFPEELPEITLEEAIGGLPSLDPEIREGKDITLKMFPNFETKRLEGLKVSKWHYPPVHSLRHVEWMQHTPTGTSAIYNKEYYPCKKDGKRIKAHHNNYRRQKWDMAGRTITQNNGVISSLACVHPGRLIKGTNLYSDARVLTIYEILIVMSLPLDWNIPDWANERFIRRVIGEGIPSNMVKRIMLELLKKLDGAR
ncbi:DNA cytosine methyltransferase [Streptococcus orisratti]|uniref:DNA (cytosine-5-)-methyltransferase n=1 Tax=Streptococcus dysgalactiae subsp. equisimilis AC-2713 TaxID=759913 RepID=A0AB33R607_STREQ|nr:MULTISPECIES: DNA cytosine methyltransferase [Streptococcus]MBM6533054.1 DNA cytosine methyltransferase [Streptococcus dysgalactiae subsp. equisimilis]MBO4125904.1 DNA cytosine methyltransferase [Streptococcus suis]MCK3917717.1 DNA cytosine methyltransferase [Streptococcus suis]WFA75165.1 DNA cytosine methyltransferase [Streptococcus suis]CCI62901.1 K00558 DNA (cytosine-5-)-methyltransferase [Streptococcus dysgalactiae subsp. equisimilis AC-2713]